MDGASFGKICCCCMLFIGRGLCRKEWGYGGEEVGVVYIVFEANNR